MEELAGLIPIIIIAVISTIAKASKNKQQHPYEQGKPAAKPQQAQPAYQPAAPVVKPASAAKPASMASQLQPALQPTVHTHLAPDCEIHDAPSSGSLNVVSPEGKDPCHDEQLPRNARAALPEESSAQSGIAMDWSANSLVKAFVMQEVLTRPCDRRRH